MAIKSILCVFSGTEKELGALHTAFSLAETYSAKLHILHISPTPSSYVGIYGEGVIESSYLIAAIEKETKERLEKAQQYATSCATFHNIPLNKKDTVVKNNKTNSASFEFIHQTGDIADIVARYGRVNDIIVVSRGGNDPSAVYDSAIISALFETARPVLLTPASTKGNEQKTKWQYKNIAIAWDGGMESARGLYNSFPFLERADKVNLLTVRGNKEKSKLETGEEAIEYLRSHNVQATGIIIAAGDRLPAEALLTRTKELESDLLVMGAYGHSRLREMVLGGITDYVLEKAEIPLLLSH